LKRTKCSFYFRRGHRRDGNTEGYCQLLAVVKSWQRFADENSLQAARKAIYPNLEAGPSLQKVTTICNGLSEVMFHIEK